MSSYQAVIANGDMREAEDQDMLDAEEDFDYDSSSSYVPSDAGESDDEPKSKTHQPAKGTKKTSTTASAHAQSSESISASASPNQAQATSQLAAEASDEGDSEDEDFEPDEDEMDVYSEVSDEDESQTAEEDNAPPGFPAHFPEKITQLLEMIPHHKPFRNIRQIVINFVHDQIDPVVLQIIANVLALAPPIALRDLAETIIQVVYECAIGPGIAYAMGVFLHDQWVFKESQFQPFMQGLRDSQVQAVFSRTDWDSFKLNHFLKEHLFIRAEPVGSETFATLYTDVCMQYPSWDYQPMVKRTLADVKNFLASLPVVPITEIADDTCGICWKTYQELAPVENAVKLPCGHVFSIRCLETLLGPKPDGWEHKLCPMCRRDIIFASTIPA